MKTRLIYTRFWIDDYVSGLTHKEKLAFLYFFTNEHVNICGIYELPDKYIKMDLKLSQTELDKIKQKLMQDNKFVFIDGWVKIINHDSYNNFKGELNEKAIEKELASVPKEITDYVYSIDTVSKEYGKGIDTLNIYNTNTNPITIKGDSKGDKTIYADFVSMLPEEYQKLIDKYGEANTKRFIEKLSIWKGANGKERVKGSDYLKILNWVVDAVIGADKKKELEDRYRQGLQKEKEWNDIKEKRSDVIPEQINNGILKILKERS
jgi:hypothetical protein